MQENDKFFTHEKFGFAQKIIFKLLKKLNKGKIIIEYKNQHYYFGHDSVGDNTATIKVHHPKFYRSVLFDGSIGAAKSYMKGDWEVDNLNKVIQILLLNQEIFRKIESPIAKFYGLIRYFSQKISPNKIKKSKNNILAHYDLGNEFFKLFLDSSMMYSCALYQPENISQENASNAKLAEICEKLKLRESDRIIEIGTGWGGFAIYAAKNFGCHVTTTTISDKQYAYVKNEITRLNLSDKITLLNKDYRLLEGSYDKLVSIEMIEAVGYEYFDTFFKKCNQLLKPGGLFFLQAITINDQSYERAKREIDFIKKYIFPGGCLPSVSAISSSIAKSTEMQLTYFLDIGMHYVKTLMDWDQKFKNNHDNLRAQGFTDSFMKMWHFYFSYCAAGFKTHYISVVHIVWRKYAY